VDDRSRFAHVQYDPQASRYRMTTGAIEELVPTNHVPRHDRGE